MQLKSYKLIPLRGQTTLDLLHPMQVRYCENIVPNNYRSCLYNQFLRFVFVSETPLATNTRPQKSIGGQVGRTEREIKNKYPSLRSGTGKTNILKSKMQIFWLICFLFLCTNR